MRLKRMRTRPDAGSGEIMDDEFLRHVELKRLKAIRAGTVSGGEVIELTTQLLHEYDRSGDLRFLNAGLKTLDGVAASERDAKDVRALCDRVETALLKLRKERGVVP
jgi:hypothetical protein